MSSNNDKKMIYKILLISEAFIFIIALVIISIFAIVLCIHFPVSEEVAQGIFTAFMAWIGAIIGFYFGQKPVREVLTRLEEKSEESIKIRNIAKGAIKQAEYAIEAGEEFAEKEEEKRR